MASLKGTTIATGTDPSLVIDTPASYTGTSLRLQAQAAPSTYKLDISSDVATNDVRWYFNQTNFGTAYTYVLSFHAGNVSIGASAASYKLDVTGTFRTTDDAGIGGANDGSSRLYVSGEALTEPYLSVNTCLGNNSTNSAFYSTLKGWLAIKIGNNVGTSGNLLNAGTAFTGYIRIWS